ncbi:MAG: AI-2E family transporter [candidate division Zixibacteria bacterium]|nr:AI-2E family transporter [candidate division Zixibacteria bacterium]
MKREQYSAAIFLGLAAVILYLFYNLVSPFFAPVAYAAILVVVSYPVYVRVLARIKSPVAASVIMCAVVTIAIVAPLIYLLAALTGEAESALDYLTEMYRSGEISQLLAKFSFPGIEALKEKIAQYADPKSLELESIVVNVLSTVSKTIGSQLTTLIANTGKSLFYFGLMLFSMFFFFRDGAGIISQLGRLIPLPANQIDVRIAEVRNVIEATIFGGIVVALLQGVAGGVLFAGVGLNSPVFWGAMMAFLSFLPIVGAFIIFVPAGVILIIGGSLVKGIIVLAVGAIVISQIDNFVRPWLIAGRTSIHTLLLFFSILGGIAMFGLLGIVLGPVIAAITVAMARMVSANLHPELATSGSTDSISATEAPGNADNTDSASEDENESNGQ